MDWSNVLSLLSTIALVGAVVFAALQVRQTNQLRKEQAAIELVHSMQSAEWASAVGLVSRLSTEGSAQLDPAHETAATAMGLRLETLGYLVYRGVVSLDLVDDLVGGMTRIAWARLAPWVMKGRADSGNEKSYEWFQWLVERLVERGPSPSPAHLRHRNWRA
jgi:hypothetical protein